MKGRFITFEGIDGAGKSSHIAAGSHWLLQQGRQVVVTREPGGTALAETLRELVLHQAMDPMTEATTTRKSKSASTTHTEPTPFPAFGKFEMPKFEMPKFEMPKFEMPKFEVPKMEVPAAFREFAEKSVTQAKDNWEKMRAASEEATDLLEGSYASASKGAAEEAARKVAALQSEVEQKIKANAEADAALGQRLDALQHRERGGHVHADEDNPADQRQDPQQDAAAARVPHGRGGGHGRRTGGRDAPRMVARRPQVEQVNSHASRRPPPRVERSDCSRRTSRRRS